MNDVNDVNENGNQNCFCFEFQNASYAANFAKYQQINVMN